MHAQIEVLRDARNYYVDDISSNCFMSHMEIFVPYSAKGARRTRLELHVD